MRRSVRLEVLGYARPLYLDLCDELVVLTLEGWEDSSCVQAAILIAGELGKPVRYLNLGGERRRRWRV